MNENAYHIELKTSQLRQKLHSVVSSKTSLLILYEYYNSLLNSANKQLIEAYIPEFIQSYLSLLNNFDPYCLSPSITQSIITQINEIAEYLSESEIKASFKDSAQKIHNKLEKFKAVLDGTIPDELITNKLCFPLLEENEDLQSQITTGILETVTIKISKAKDENKLLLIPSEVKIEPRLQKQVETSWHKAVEIVRRYNKKIPDYHKVVIQFDKRVGFYRGNSLGAALTLAFIEELLSYYNSPVVIRTGKGIALTGGLNEDSSLIATSKEVIEKKVENVFFSPIQTFVVPKDDLAYAEEKLKTLRQEFPKRDLTLAGIKTFDDLLDSRKLIDIRKQKILTRTAKGIKKNKISVSIISIFILVFAYLFFIKMDTNPAYLQYEGYVVEVKNKYNQILWTKKVGVALNLVYRTNMIIDTNRDGINEVIVSMAKPGDTTLTEKNYGIVCYDNNQEEIWNYEFQDFVETTDTKHSEIYQSYLMDAKTYDNKTILYIIAHNSLYPSAVYKLDAATGKRLSGTLWNAGRINAAIVGDFNEDGIDEVVGTCVNNAYSTSAFFSIDVDKLNGQAPATPKYTFEGMKAAQFNSYILLPKTDLTIYRNKRYNLPVLGDLIFYEKSKEFGFHIREGNLKTDGNLEYRFDKNLNLILIDYTDPFLMARDKLVKSGELNPPLTNTVEYRKILEKGLRYWDGEGFVKQKMK
jgi:phage pi2 protein 07